MAGAMPRVEKIRDAVAAEQAAWDRATERRADAEYALEQFKERQDLSEEEKREFGERCQRMQVAIDVAVQEEKAAELLWRQALNRAEREAARKVRRLR
jgi:predicted  nucleic acid-binding Zn-ribbon protein